MIAMRKEDMEFIEDKIIYYCKAKGMTPYRTELYDITPEMPIESMRIQFEIDHMIDALWSLNDPDCDVWLWNNMHYIRGITGHTLPDGYKANYKKFLDLKEKGDGGNINDSIETKRLILKPVFDSDLNEYFHRMLTEGDFEVYTGKSLREELIPAYTSKDTLDYTFGMYLKSDGTFIGVAGLYPENNQRFQRLSRMEGQYYVFKEHRLKGYAKEAMTAIVDLFFTGNLKGELLTRYAYLHKVVHSEPVVLKIVPCLNNEASCRLAESLGFVREGILHHFFESEAHTDAASYYMDVEIYKKLRGMS